MHRLFLFFSLLVLVGTASAQSPDDPLAHPMLGVRGGVTYAKLLGSNDFVFRYSDVMNGRSSYFEFNDLGAGTGAMGGLELQFPVSQHWGFVAMISDISMNTGVTERATRPNVPGVTGESISTTVTSYNSNWNFTGVDFLVRYRWASSGLYNLLGAGYSAMVLNNFDASQTIASNGTYDFETGSTNKEYVLTGFRSDGYYNAQHFDLNVGIGYAIPLTFLGRYALTPQLVASIPLNNIFAKDAIALNDASGYRSPNLFHAAFSLGFSMVLGEDSAATVPHTALDSLLASKPESHPIMSAAPQSAAPQSAAPQSAAPRSAAPDGTAPHGVRIAGEVRDAAGKPLRATLIATDLANNTTCATTQSDLTGAYTLSLPSAGRYSVSAQAEGFLFRTIGVTIGPDVPAVHVETITLPPTHGTVPLLVFFGFNDATLHAESYPELLRIVDLLKHDTSLSIEIDGHTDNVGTDDYNQTLSERRAEAVANFVATHGVLRSRVTTKGLGRSQPVADNTTEQGRTKNRRVEMVVK